MAIRTLLIKPRKVCAQRGSVQVSFEPLGLLAIAAFVRKYREHAVSFVDAQSESGHIYRGPDGLFRMGMSDALLRERIERERPDVVGISALFEANEIEVIALARLVKAVSPRTVVVVGGLDAGVRYKDYLRCEAVDLVVRGDGEETFAEILDRVDAQQSLSGIQGTCERSTLGDSVAHAPRVPVIPFDDYPYPARDLVPRELYDSHSAQRRSWPFAHDCPALLMQGSRGCKLKCAFCDIVAVQDQWHAHSPEYIVDEIEHCIRAYGMKEVTFVDDNFMMDKKWALRICELMIERKLNISLDIMSGTSVWTLSEATIDTMIAAGLHRVLLPIESGNPETLRFIKKPVDLDKVARMIEYCNRKGLYTYANLIIGFPFETERDIRTTIDWARTCGADQVNFNVAEPFVDARMYHIYEENGWIVHGPDKSWRTKYFTREELETMARQAAREYTRNRFLFYLRPANIPRYLLPKIASVSKLKFAARMGLFVLFDGHRSSDREPAAILRLPGFRRATAP